MQRLHMLPVLTREAYAPCLKRPRENDSAEADERDPKIARTSFGSTVASDEDDEATFSDVDYAPDVDDVWFELSGHPTRSQVAPTVLVPASDSVAETPTLPASDSIAETPAVPASDIVPATVPESTIDSVQIPLAVTLLNELDFEGRPDILAIVKSAVPNATPTYNRLTKSHDRMLRMVLTEPSERELKVNCFEPLTALHLQSQVVPGDVILLRRIKLDKKWNNGVAYGDDTKWLLFRGEEVAALNTRLEEKDRPFLDDDERAYAIALWRWYQDKLAAEASQIDPAS